MDDTTKRAYVDARLAKARDDLSTAHDDLRNDHWRGATNRAYYAIFHVASAALLWLNVERVKHSGIQSAFNEFFVKPGLLEPEYGRIYSRARKAREEQDYDLEATPLTAEDARRIVAEAEGFVARLQRYLQDVGAIK